MCVRRDLHPFVLHDLVQVVRVLVLHAVRRLAVLRPVLLLEEFRIAIAIRIEFSKFLLDRRFNVCANASSRGCDIVIQLTLVHSEFVALSSPSCLLRSRRVVGANVDLEIVKATTDRSLAFAWLLNFHRATRSEVVIPGVEYRGLRAPFVATMGGNLMRAFMFGFAAAA